MALSYPLVSFRLKHQERQIRFYPATSARMSETARVEKICGTAFMNQAVSLELGVYGLALRGWLGSPTLLRRQADCQYFFVNQRMVKDRILNHVIKTAYQEQLGKDEGTYPSYVLYLQIDPSEVDVNVHPTKQEVRFSQPRHIHDFISKGVGEALGQYLESDPAGKMEYNSPKRQATDAVISPVLTNVPVMVKAQRYALIEDEEGVTVCDLQKGKESLLKTYFMELWGRVLTKNLLFAQMISLPEATLLDDEVVARLNDIGYWVKVQSHQLMVLAVPLISMHTNPCEYLPALITEKVIRQEKISICEWLARHLSMQCLQSMDHETFTWLLDTWMKNGNQTAWRHYSHVEFEQLIALPSGV